MKKNELVWNVYVEDFNGKRIRKFNIFDHGRLMDDFDKNIRKIKTFEEFCEEFERDLRYYYWSKCEWEVILSGFPAHDDFHEEKIDVFDQIMLNKEIFFKYVWNTIHPRKKV